MYQLAVFEAEKSKKEASLEAFKHQEVEKEKNEAIKRVTCTYCNCPFGNVVFSRCLRSFLTKCRLKNGKMPISRS